MTISYGKWRIEVIAGRNDGGWAHHIVVTAGEYECVPPPLAKVFATEEEAIQTGIEEAKRWIDERTATG